MKASKKGKDKERKKKEKKGRKKRKERKKKEHKQLFSTSELAKKPNHLIREGRKTT
jgi:hypothetical protein